MKRQYSLSQRLKIGLKNKFVIPAASLGLSEIVGEATNNQSIKLVTQTILNIPSYPLGLILLGMSYMAYRAQISAHKTLNELSQHYSQQL